MTGVMTRRRAFLTGAGAVAAGAALIDAFRVSAQPQVKWRLSTAWTPTMDILAEAYHRLVAS